MDTNNKPKDGTAKLPNTFGETVMEFAKLSTDNYRNGSILGQMKLIEELQLDLQRRHDALKKIYEQTEIGKILKKQHNG
tara:strand:+ start:373 stop:609 length:237 start_codon:yes stop_codon:yes gene_type:complete